MMIYLLKSFETEENKDIYKNNPPLSEEGIRQARKTKLTIPKVTFDYCFTSSYIADYASGMLVVGDKMIIDRDKRLNKKGKEESTEDVEKRVKDFLSFLKTYSPKVFLVVADQSIIEMIRDQKELDTIYLS